MSIVLPRQIQAGLNRGPINFADSFIRADQPDLVGDNWFSCISTDPTTNANMPTVGTSINETGGTGMAFGGVAGLNTCRTACYPLPVDHNAILALSQTRKSFAQMTVVQIVAGGAGGCATGLLVMGLPNTQNCYWLQNASDTGLMSLRRGLAASVAYGATLSAGFAAYAVGDVLRMEVTPAPADNTIEIFKNGVSILTFVDNNALRPTKGLYGIGFFGTNVAVPGTLKYSQFSGGF